MDLGTQLSGSQSAKCVRRVHGYVNSVGFGFGAVNPALEFFRKSLQHSCTCIHGIVHAWFCITPSRRSIIATSWHTQPKEWASARGIKAYDPPLFQRFDRRGLGFGNHKHFRLLAGSSVYFCKKTLT